MAIGKRNILIVYVNTKAVMRSSVKDHLNSFRNYASSRCYYLNLGFWDIPTFIGEIKFDLIVFHHSFLIYKARKEGFDYYIAKAQSLKKLKAIKAILPQDEFMHMDLVCEFINEFKIDCVFSVAPETEWGKLYRTVDFDKVRFYRVLTGYIDPATVKRIERIERKIPCRPIDIGYRVGAINMLWGRHNFLKKKIADIVLDKAKAINLVTDIVVGTQYGYSGDDWYKFLVKCKYTLGVEGGVSLLDYDGSFEAKVREYLKQFRNASFDELETACFPGQDGNIKLFALSPRHLEACATKTCQILLEGGYNGVLLPGKHYIELLHDFSNIDEVLDIVKSDTSRNGMVERAYQDVILSGEFTYRKFVQFVIDSALSTNIDQVKQTGLSVIWQSLFYLIMKIADWFTVPSIWLLWKFIPKCVWDMRRKAKLGVKLMEPPNILN